MSAIAPGYLEIIDFIARNNPEAVIAFRPSPEAEQRLATLIEREAAGALTADEKSELDHFMHLEHILRMAKAKARLMLSGA